MLLWKYVGFFPSLMPIFLLIIINIDREEGFRALFKGGPARVIRSSPQFGFTLLGEIDLDFYQCVHWPFMRHSVWNSEKIREYLLRLYLTWFLIATFSCDIATRKWPFYKLATILSYSSPYSILGMKNPFRWKRLLHLDLMKCPKSGPEMPSKFCWTFMAILVLERQRLQVDLFPCQIQGCRLRHLHDRIIRASFIILKIDKIYPFF